MVGTFRDQRAEPKSERFAVGRDNCSRVVARRTTRRCRDDWRDKCPERGEVGLFSPTRAPPSVSVFCERTAEFRGGQGGGPFDCGFPRRRSLTLARARKLRVIIRRASTGTRNTLSNIYAGVGECGSVTLGHRPSPSAREGGRVCVSLIEGGRRRE